MGPVAYRNKKFRITIAVAAAFYMVIHGTRFDVYRALTSPAFYLVLAISFAAALLLIEFVHYFTQKLDIEYGWRSRFKERLVAQLLLGVIVPLVIDTIIFSVYFSFLGQNIFENGFFHIDLPYIAALLLLLNFYYCLCYFMLTSERYAEQRVALALQGSNRNRENDNGTTFEISTKGQHLYLKTDEIVCFYRNNRNVYLITQNEKEYPVKYTISQLQERYGYNGFSRINRGMLINLQMVTGYATGERKNTLQLILSEKHNGLISQLGKTQFQVTKEYLKEFKVLFED